MKLKQLFAALLCATASAPIFAEDPNQTARPIPATRPEMKQLLEDMKGRKERIPLPELTEAAKAELGERAEDYESRLRFHYLIDSEGSAFGSRPRSAPGTPTPPAQQTMRLAISAAMLMRT